jgi:arabinose-5-phosphate isomerase
MSQEQAKRVLRIEADAVARLIDRIDGNFDKAVDLIMGCRGRVVVTGLDRYTRAVPAPC